MNAISPKHRHTRKGAERTTDLPPFEDPHEVSWSALQKNLASIQATKLADDMESVRGFHNSETRIRNLREESGPEVRLLADIILRQRNVDRARQFIRTQNAIKRAGNSTYSRTDRDAGSPLFKEVIDLLREIAQRSRDEIVPTIPNDPNVDLLMRFAGKSVFARALKKSPTPSPQPSPAQPHKTLPSPVPAGAG